MRELRGLADHLASCRNTADSGRTLTALDGQQTEPRLALTLSNPYFMKPCYPRLWRQSLQLCGSAQSVGAGGNCVRVMDVPWIYMMSSADTDSASSWVMLGQFHFFTASSRTSCQNLALSFTSSVIYRKTLQPVYPRHSTALRGCGAASGVPRGREVRPHVTAPGCQRRGEVP